MVAPYTRGLSEVHDETGVGGMDKKYWYISQ